MCGSLIGALSLSLDKPVRENRVYLFTFVLALSLGRVLSYSLIGFLMGWMGHHLIQTISPEYGYLILQSVSIVVILGIALYLGGWFPRFAVIENLGQPLWKKLEPIGRRLIPIKSLWQAFSYGIVWGWLPCGLVYSTVLLSVTSGDALQGFTAMMSFGLGTLPSVMGLGLITSWIRHFTTRPYLRKIAALLLIALACANLYFGLVYPSGHQHHH